MTLNAKSGHGTLIARAPNATPTVFTTIAELGDITLPELMRNEFDSTTQNEDIDSYILGVLRRSPTTVGMNFVDNDATQDHLTGLYKAIIDKSMDGYRFTLPGAVTIWVMSGQVSRIVPKAPVDGKLSLDVTLRFSGKFTINGIVIG